MVMLLIGEMTLTSCSGRASVDTALPEGNTSTSTKTDQTKDDDNTLDSKDENTLLDSLDRLSSRVDKLNLKINEQRSENNNYKTAIENLKKKTSLSTLVSWVIMTISLIIAIFAFVRTNRVRAYGRRSRNDIEELKRSLTEVEERFMNVSRNMGASVSSLSSRDYKELLSRIYRIERYLDQYTQPKPTQQKTSNPVESNNVVSSEQYGFFGLPSKMSETGAYFKRLNESRDSEARFQVIVRNERAEFKPIEGTQYFNDLKSSDTIKMALDIQGCAPSEAKQMTVIKSGEAKLVDNRWVIIKNAIIVLSR